jgi:hypothetical protein
VRLVSADCSNPEDRKSYQQHVFSAGTLIIGSGLAFNYPGNEVFPVIGFSFSQVFVQRVSHQQSLTSRLELSFVTNHHERDVYSMKFEGRPEVVEPLYRAASANMHSHIAASAGPPASSGCLVMLAFPLALTTLFIVFLR